MRLKLDAAVIKNKSGLGIRAGSFSPGAFFPFFRRALPGSTRRGKTKKEK